MNYIIQKNIETITFKIYFSVYIYSIYQNLDICVAVYLFWLVCGRVVVHWTVLFTTFKWIKHTLVLRWKLFSTNCAEQKTGQSLFDMEWKMLFKMTRRLKKYIVPQTPVSKLVFNFFSFALTCYTCISSDLVGFLKQRYL